MSEIENEPREEPSLPGPLGVLVLPFVLAADGTRWLSGQVRRASRWLWKTLTPLTIRLRKLADAIWRAVGRILKPILHPLTFLSQLLDRFYEWITSAMKPLADRFYAGPLALGRAWGRFKVHLGALIRRCYRWLASTRIVQSFRRLTQGIRSAFRRQTAAIRNAMARMRSAIRSRRRKP